MTLWGFIVRKIRSLADISGQIDISDAAARIRDGIWFRGANVWILAFSIIIASVGLNVNSTAVIIGAMLISPLMGPIIGAGLAMGTDDVDLLTSSAKNLLVMVLIALVASFLYFLISPLRLVNPTELLARTTPSIYDVLIAFFGGFAGILENCRKERGTVLSGVAIATALMPPLCTAGYGLAHFNIHYFSGAMYLFLINCVFIILSTWLMVKFLRFPKVEGGRLQLSHRSRITGALLVAFLIPSIWSAFSMVRENNFERKAIEFVEANKIVGRSYIYDYKVEKHKGRRYVNVKLAGGDPEESDLEALYASAGHFGLKKNQISVSSHALGMTESEMKDLVQTVYDKADEELQRKEESISALRSSVDSLSAALEALSAKVAAADSAAAAAAAAAQSESADTTFYEYNISI